MTQLPALRQRAPLIYSLTNLARERTLAATDRAGAESIAADAMLGYAAVQGRIGFSIGARR